MSFLEMVLFLIVVWVIKENLTEMEKIERRVQAQSKLINDLKWKLKSKEVKLNKLYESHQNTRQTVNNYLKKTRIKKGK